LPYTTIKVLNASDVLQVQNTPTAVLGWGAGGFGGDIWGLSGYNVYRADDPAGPFVLHDSVLGSIEDYKDTIDLETNTQYSYYVTEVIGALESAPSNIVTCRTKMWDDCLVAPATAWAAESEPAAAWSACEDGQATAWTDEEDPQPCGG